jgi:hypothetical protein
MPYIHGRIDPNERFRDRRRRDRRRLRWKRVAAAVVVLGLVAGLVLGATFITGRDGARPAVTNAKESSTPKSSTPKSKPMPARAARPVRLPRAPREVRGVHVTMGLASIRGKLDQYMALRAYGLNTIELDVKDENGYVGFVRGAPAVARRIGAARDFYDPARVAADAHSAGLYLIGRVVVFEDPTLTASRPDLAIQYPDGSVWKTTGGQGWANPYDRRVWKYDVDVAAAAVKAGFDEIQFDYVRFPTDGNVSAAVYRHRRDEPKGRTIGRFIAYAAGRLHALGARVSADLFGLAATRDLGIGQVPRTVGRHLDAVYPMVYPSHYVKGEYDLTDPEAFPGRTVAHSLHDYKRQLKGDRVRIVPWLQDFSINLQYGLFEVADQIDAARRQHVGGFLLWNPLGVYTREALGAR